MNRMRVQACGLFLRDAMARPCRVPAFARDKSTAQKTPPSNKNFLVSPFNFIIQNRPLDLFRFLLEIVEGLHRAVAFVSMCRAARV
jgi:hypothetical protein